MFLDLSRNVLIDKFIEEHTQVASKDPPKKLKKFYDTKRNSSDMAFAWRENAAEEDIFDVQKLCDKPMNTLGYIPIVDVPNDSSRLKYPVMVDKSKVNIYD